MAFGQQRWQFDANLAAPGMARWASRQFLAGAHVGTLADDLALVVSELVTNAVTHGLPPIELAITVSPLELRVEVTDCGSGVPVRQQSTVAQVGGRGLAIVDTISNAWGVTALAVGKTVWCAIDAHPD